MLALAPLITIRATSSRIRQATSKGEVLHWVIMLFCKVSYQLQAFYARNLLELGPLTAQNQWKPHRHVCHLVRAWSISLNCL